MVLGISTIHGWDAEAHEKQLLGEGPALTQGPSDSRVHCRFFPSVSVDSLHLLEKEPGLMKFNSYDPDTKTHFTRFIGGSMMS